MHSNTFTSSSGGRSPPECPSCREKMSSVEVGFFGLWSCIYCEGVWLPYEAVEGLASKADVNLTRYIAPPCKQDGPEGMRCPSCVSSDFVSLTARDSQVHSCTSCRGLFLPKQSARAFAAELGANPWALPSFPLFRPSSNEFHPVDAAGTLALVLVSFLF